MHIEKIGFSLRKLTVSDIEFTRIFSALQLFIREGGGDLEVTKSLIEYIQTDLREEQNKSVTL